MGQGRALGEPGRRVKRATLAGPGAVVCFSKMKAEQPSWPVGPDTAKACRSPEATLRAAALILSTLCGDRQV